MVIKDEENKKVVSLGKPREGTPVAVIDYCTKCSEDEIFKAAYELFMDEYFGTSSEEFSEGLFCLMKWHFDNNYFDNSLLLESDIERCFAISAFSSLNLQYISASTLTYYPILSIDENYREYMILLIPMIVKVPIVSIKRCIEIDSWYIFSKVRESEHKYADEIISYLYEIQVTNYKLYRSFIKVNEFIERIESTELSILDNDKVDLIFHLEYITIFIKSIIEKIIVVLAYSYEINTIENRKTHKSRISLLNENIDLHIKEQFYYEDFLKFISSENIETLNRIRTGILHKKGVSKIQIHKVIEFDINELGNLVGMLWGYFEHTTVATICMLSMLTDKLVAMDPPAISFDELPTECFEEYFSRYN